MKSELNIKRALYPPGYKSSYSLSVKSSTPFLSELADFTLRQLIPESVWATGQLLDLKGCDPQIARALPVSAPHHSSQPELLAIVGSTFVCADPNEQQPELFAVPFEVRLTSEFLSFQGFSHIEHKVKERRSGELPSFLRLKDLARVFPAEIKYLSFGLDLFKPRRFSSFLAFTPTVTQSLLLEANSQDMRISMQAHSLSSRQELPFQENSLLVNISSFLLEQTNFDLLGDYKSKSEAKT